MALTARRWRGLEPYQNYTESGIEWLGPVPAHWDVRRLRSTVTSCQNGIWGEEPNGLDDVVCVRVADFNRLSLTTRVSDPTLRSIDPRVMPVRGLRYGDLLLEKSGGGENQPVGAVVMYNHDVPAVCSNFVARMEVADNHDSRFLAYLHAALYALRVNTRHIKQSTGIQNLDSSTYLEEKVGIPPESEQRAVAAFLDRETAKIDALVEKKERLLELLDEERIALVTRAVTEGLNPSIPKKESGAEWLGRIPAHWEVRRAKFVSTKIGSGKTPSGGAEVYVPDGVMLLRSQNVHFSGLRLDDVAFIDAATDAEMVASRVEDGDVLLNITGASLGRCCVARLNGGAANVNQHVCIIRPRRAAVSSAYLAAVIGSRVGQSQIFTTQDGISRDALNFEQIGSLVVPLPPMREQLVIGDSIGRETARIDLLGGRISVAIQNLKEYRAALISAAVTGKIDVRAAAR